MKRLLILITASLGLLILVDLFLRLGLGMGNPPLLEKDPFMGYFPKPNQSTKRFGHRIFYNQFGFRSPPFEFERQQDGKVRILCVGDSVTNGDSRVDQDETYPYIMERILRYEFEQKAEVLNASAGGWAPENIWEFLKNKGIYNSDKVLLQLGTEDFTQAKAPQELVGLDAFFPDRKPLCALCEFWNRYLGPRIVGHRFPNLDANPLPSAKQFEKNIELLNQDISLIRSRKALPYVILTINREEVDQGSMNPDMRQRVRALLIQSKVPFADLLEVFPKSESRKYFQDVVHPNAEGNRMIAETAAKLIMKR